MPEKKLSVYDVLQRVQAEIKVPKRHYNDYGEFYYRSLEDIFEALKDLQKKYNFQLIIGDDMAVVDNRIYVKATVNFIVGNEKITVSAFAREADIKKGMDVAQITGAASSYARKYALSGLLLLDDVQDPDMKEEPKTEKLQATVMKKAVKTYESNQNGNDFPKDRKQKFIDSIKKLQQEKQIPDSVLMTTLQMYGYKDLESVNSPEKAFEIYKAVKNIKVKNAPKPKKEKKNDK